MDPAAGSLPFCVPMSPGWVAMMAAGGRSNWNYHLEWMQLMQTLSSWACKLGETFSTNIKCMQQLSREQQ